MKIKNLLFDLGGVIMDIERQRCVEAFKRLGMDDIDQFLGDYGQTGAFGQVESGDIDAAEFHRVIRGHIKNEVTDEEIDRAFCEFLVGIPVHRLASLRRLAERYDIYLLSNTNLIMWNSRIAEEFRGEGREIGDYFKGTVTSFEAKSLKPGRQIFDYAAAHLHISPAETLFLDDSMENCVAARSYGWHAAHVAVGAEFIDIISKVEAYFDGKK
jgi:putative hydrolase of the HAD superfamily